MVNDVVIVVELTTVTVPGVTPVPDTVTVVPVVVKPVPVSVTGTVVPRTPLFELMDPSVGTGGLMTVRVNACDAFGETPLLALKVMSYVPLVPAGTPLSEPVTALNVTPVGSAPVSDSPGEGTPVAVTANEPAIPIVNDVLAALVIAGAWLTVSVKFCGPLVPAALLAVKPILYGPLAVGVPANVPVPSWLSVNVTPPGSAPVSFRAGVGKPVVVNVNEPATPNVKVALFALVIAGTTVPVPCRATLWLAPVELRALSVNVAALAMLRTVCGMKPILRLQLAPGTSEKLLVQSAGVPEPGTCWKEFAPMLKPGATAAKVWVPMFCTVTDCGLSVLVLPSTVAAKLNVGGCER